MDLESHKQQPIVNRVEVLNGLAYRDSVLRGRVAPLVRAQTLQELYDALDPTARNLSQFGSVLYKLDVAGPATQGGVLPVKTIVELALPYPDQSLQVSTITARDLAGFHGRWLVFNKLGLGDALEFTAQAQSKPFSISAGGLSAALPLSIGAGKVSLSGFFFNQDCPWASHSFASHGISAKIDVPWTANLLAELGIEAQDGQMHGLCAGAGDVVRAAATASALKLGTVARFTHTGPAHSVAVRCERSSLAYTGSFTKLTTSFNWFRSLVGLNTLVADLRSSGGYIHGTERLLDRFLLGGPNSVYGFRYNSIGPHDGRDFIGGQAYYSARVSLTSQLPFHAPSPIRLTALLCTAAIRQQNEPNLSVLQNLRRLFALSPVASVAWGLTYTTEPASFEVLYALPVKADCADVTNPGFHVSVGLNFA